MVMKILAEIFVLFTVKQVRTTTGHTVTIAKEQCTLDIRKFSFSQRTVNEWNTLFKIQDSKNVIVRLKNILKTEMFLQSHIK